MHISRIEYAGKTGTPYIFLEMNMVSPDLKTSCVFMDRASLRDILDYALSR